MTRLLGHGLGVMAVILAFGCATGDKVDAELERFLPYFGGNLTLMEELTPVERNNLALVASDLVAVLVQVPELPPQTTTIQFSSPVTSFGNAVLRALQDASYGIKFVTADQGTHYMRYSQRLAKTESGELEEFELRVAKISLQRSYRRLDGRLLPDAPMSIEGTTVTAGIAPETRLFSEGGVGERFISGIQTEVPSPGSLKEVSVIPETELDSELQPQELLREIASDIRFQNRAPTEKALDRVRRTVLIVEPQSQGTIGPANKRAIRLLSRSWSEGDVFEITACTDTDGHDPSAQFHIQRIAEEFIGAGVPLSSLREGPCRRSAYRVPGENAPQAIEVLQLRSHS